MKKLLRSLSLFSLVTLSAVAAEKPTHANMRYDDTYGRSTLDLWLPKAGDKPAPLVVLFHGGGFKYGNKTKIPLKKDFLRLVERGYAVASVGYPLLGDKGRGDAIGPQDYEKIFVVTAKSLDFLRAHAVDYRLDMSRVVTGGTSAGAMIAEYLTYERDYGVTACIAIQQPFALEPALKFIKAPGGPRLFLYTESGARDKIHSPVHAQKIKAHCDQVGVPCELYGTKTSGLPPPPDGQSLVEYVRAAIESDWRTSP